MIKIVNGDLFDATEGIICHQVNCKGNMGRGVAKTFKKKFPDSFDLYVQACREVENSADLLGKLCFFGEDDIYTCCMFAQDDWRGRDVCNTNYAAFRHCCQEIAYMVDALTPNSKSLQINMPYGIGAGLGGGEWDIIYSIIEEELKDYNVVLWKLK